MPEQAGLLNGFFLYGEPNGSVQEIDMEMMKFIEEGEETWELWMTIHSPSHPDYVYAAYLEDYDPNIEYGEDGDNYAEPGVIYQKKINLTELLGHSPESKFNNYRINYYENYVSFEVNDKEVGRWNNKLGEHELELLTSTFWAHWLERYQYDTSWDDSLKVEWIREKYDMQ